MDNEVGVFFQPCGHISCCQVLESESGEAGFEKVKVALENVIVGDKYKDCFDQD